MYFPYLRGKQFEIEALLNVPNSVFRNTLPILEPVNSSNRFRLYPRLAEQGIPLILIMNPQHPQGNKLLMSDVQTLINTHLAFHPSLIVGYVIDQHFSLKEFNSFLRANPTRDKAVIFRHSPMPADLTAIQTALVSHPVSYLIFDERKTNTRLHSSFSEHPNRILITDGFQKQNRNADYPSISTFDSNYHSWSTDGWGGIGDYLTIGDEFTEGGGAVFVVTLHITAQSADGLVVHHFSSTVSSSVRGLSQIKFAEANNLLVGSHHIRPLSSSGLLLYRDWHTRSHNPQLGAAKKASLQHHMELLSGLV